MKQQLPVEAEPQVLALRLGGPQDTPVEEGGARGEAPLRAADGQAVSREAGGVLARLPVDGVSLGQGVLLE